MTWKDAEDIALALMDEHPDVDPLTVRFTDLHKWVVALPEFSDDPKASNEFSTLLKQMSDRGVAVLMATHDLFRAKESGSRVGIMKHGRLVATLSTADIGHADLERLYLEHMRD